MVERCELGRSQQALRHRQRLRRFVAEFGKRAVKYQAARSHFFGFEMASPTFPKLYPLPKNPTEPRLKGRAYEG
jgi:hypothetical protein